METMTAVERITRDYVEMPERIFTPERAGLSHEVERADFYQKYLTVISGRVAHDKPVLKL